MSGQRPACIVVNIHSPSTLDRDMSDDISPRPTGAIRVTLKDVARRLGISHVSVSVALRDREGVSQELRIRIKETAAAMGYTPEPMARALAVYRHSRHSHSIHSALAWLNFWQDPKDLRSFPEFDLYWKGASEAARSMGYHLEEFRLRETATQKRLENILRARGIRGVMIPPHKVQIDWTGFDWDGFAIVKIGHSQQTPHAYVAAPDQVGNTLLAYERVKAAGYRRIGYVGSRERVMKWWFSGAIFMEQILEPTSNRIPPLFLKETYTTPNLFELESTLSTLRRWIQRHEPKVIICETGHLAIAIEKIGLKIPQDLALVNLSCNSSSGQSGIDQNPLLIGKAAVDTLIGLITRNEWGERKTGHTMTVMGTWIDGPSLPPIRPAGAA